MSAAEVKEIKDHIDLRFTELRKDMTVSGATGLEQTMELLYSRAKYAHIGTTEMLDNLRGLANNESARHGAVLAGLAAIDDPELSDAQIQQIASQINLDEDVVAEAVRMKLSQALGN